MGMGVKRLNGEFMEIEIKHLEDDGRREKIITDELQELKEFKAKVLALEHVATMKGDRFTEEGERYTAWIKLYDLKGLR